MKRKTDGEGKHMLRLQAAVSFGLYGADILLSFFPWIVIGDDQYNLFQLALVRRLLSAYDYVRVCHLGYYHRPDAWRSVPGNDDFAQRPGADDSQDHGNMEGDEEAFGGVTEEGSAGKERKAGAA